MNDPTKHIATETLLEVKDLHTCFDIEGESAWAVSGVSFDVHADEFLGIVGESGSGKSVTALSIMRLIPDPPGKIARGEIHFGGRDLLALDYAQMRKVRGREIAMIFQEPMTSLNPVFTIGMQVAETLRHHEDIPPAAARERAVEVLTQVGIPDAAKRLDDYPHQFSGGMRQRVMIAMALICRPKLLIADEPTTALDVTIQAQILDLMKELLASRRGSSVILITHDLAVVAETCQRAIVMYGGKIQEIADISTLFDDPKHPYTRGLLDSIPTEQNKGRALRAIPGNVPGILSFPAGCKYCTRCPELVERCKIDEPPLVEITPGHHVRCHLVDGPQAEADR
ncbi:MAG: ABC transporter ATP-binding protein [Planctomycetota bacterium]|nr:ABC transporter ATP-binding protein [Planctomycetota bacterium]MDP6762753.1 ABC transporter ATP-binding protein [Planctomycetota bacterium]MDP6989358.1 ABC transporter ATP-binding protein [Planctomycetota bacterium]